MYLQPYALQTLVPGEPTPDALYREEFYSNQDDGDGSTEPDLIEPEARQQSILLRAANTVGVGKFFA